MHSLDANNEPTVIVNIYGRQNFGLDRITEEFINLIEPMEIHKEIMSMVEEQTKLKLSA
jgi:hypothetical protein